MPRQNALAVATFNLSQRKVHYMYLFLLFTENHCYVQLAFATVVGCSRSRPSSTNAGKDTLKDAANV